MTPVIRPSGEDQAPIAGPQDGGICTFVAVHVSKRGRLLVHTHPIMPAAPDRTKIRSTTHPKRRNERFIFRSESMTVADDRAIPDLDSLSCLENLDYCQHRGLDEALVRRLANCEWISKHQNILVTGAMGVGKTYLACAFADKACREGYSVLYRRKPRLLHELTVARATAPTPKPSHALRSRNSRSSSMESAFMEQRVSPRRAWSLVSSVPP
jgi:hypothetical protein